MEKKVLTKRDSQVRKVLLWMPAVVLPLLTLLFWVVGGGRGKTETVTALGFLMRLPGAHVAPVTRLDKMGYYDLAHRDSVAERQRLAIQQNYARQLGLESSNGKPGVVLAGGSRSESDTKVVQVKEKLEELKRVVAGKAVDGTDLRESLRSGGLREGLARGGLRTQADRAPEIERLEKVMNVLQRDEASNGEIRELSAVVEKLLAVQQPRGDTGMTGETIPGVATQRFQREQVKAGMRMQGAQAVLTVRALPDEADTAGGFDSSVIEALVPEGQVLVSGAEMRLELVRDVQIGRQRVPAGTPLFGTVSLSGERLRVGIGSIAVQGGLLPVNLEVDDEDGMPGIYIPGAPVSESLRESAGQELGSLGPGALATSVAGQAAGAGVVLARSLIGKKVRPVKVTIPAGYRVLLHAKNAAL
ncbi:conjugative transposon protein TraM [Puia dinghuensis]|uniref:Conjugative transposon protein TraM n=1 Tax=Puia dinghuensis TaxID=1792502 RepID=A0A8J2XW07_9BACT|nr:conjugative transposon protein TraM [Puia dinghuensis]GGB20131.1 conjugative transposon protein TraM [Puia dinghuensis]